MQNYLDFFAANRNGIFATIDDTGIKTRVFQYLWGEEGKLYFGTNNKKEVYAQMKKNPAVNFCAYDNQKFASMSASGNAVFVDCMDAKKRALDENPNIKAIFGSPENPELEIFYIDVHCVNSFNFEAGKESLNLK